MPFTRQYPVRKWRRPKRNYLSSLWYGQIRVKIVIYYTHYSIKYICSIMHTHTWTGVTIISCTLYRFASKWSVCHAPYYITIRLKGKVRASSYRNILNFFKTKRISWCVIIIIPDNLLVRRCAAGHSLIRTYIIIYYIIRYIRPRQIPIRLTVQSAKNEPHKTIKNARSYTQCIMVPQVSGEPSRCFEGQNRKSKFHRIIISSPS